MVSTLPQWFRKPESEVLEYKSFAATKHRETIVRAVVALLNHKGGHVIVGVDDEGRPEQGIGRLAHEVERLQHAVVDAIEPRPLELVTVRAVEVDGTTVLELAVSKAPVARGPYAERRNGLYGFWVRSGPTTRALGVAEVREKWTRTPPEPHYERWDHSLERANEAATVFVLQAQLGPEPTKLDRSALDSLLAAEHRRTLSRRPMGWTVVDDYDRLERRGADRELGAQGARKWLRCRVKQGIFRFEARTEFLRWKAPPPLATESVIYPFPLVEGTASFFWLLAAYGDKVGLEDGELRCSLGLWRPQGLRLGPQRPGTPAWDWGGARWSPAHDNTNVERTNDYGWSDIRSAPDRVARSFVAHVYEDFGYDDDDIPFWSAGDGRFVFEM